MGARTYRELVVFQRSAELRTKVLAILAKSGVARDRRFCDQMRDAARSAPRNIAEGFGRYNPAEFAQFLDVAIASLDELDNHLRDAAEQALVDAATAADVIRLCARCRWMAVRLRTYLRREAAKHRAPRRGTPDKKPTVR